MEQIKKLLRKYKDATITEEENLFLEYLLIDQIERFVLEQQLSPEELLLLGEWERERRFYKETADFNAFLKNEANINARTAWVKFSEKMKFTVSETETPEELPARKNRKYPIRRYITLTLAAAAAIALVITLSLPLLRNNGAEILSPSVQMAQTQITQQFVTGGNMKKITLADGSVVHLNMGTTLSLRKGRFNGHIREVWLDEGEAFFEVTKDKKRPFIVHTPDGLSTRVLGTSFNIKAYRELGEQVVSVKTGKVQVSRENGDKVLLNPDNKASFDSDKQTLTAGITDGSLAADWRKGTIVLNDASFKEVALRLHQAFGIQVSGNGVALSRIRVNSSFSTDTSLPVIAKALASVYNARYRIDNQQLQFYYE